MPRLLPLPTIVLIIASLGSCSKKSMSSPIIPITVPTDTSKTFLALGDSYTIGQSVPASENFPNQTVNNLRAKQIKYAEPDIIATTGWTTTDLLEALATAPPKHSYSIVSLLIGVNNQYQGKNIEQYKSDFTLLLNMAIKYAGDIKKNVYVLSIPDYSVTPFARNSDTAAIAKEIDAYNLINKTITAQSGVNYLDITAISRQAKTDQSLTAGDGLHPSGSQYKLWAGLLAAMIQ